MKRVKRLLKNDNAVPIGALALGLIVVLGVAFKQPSDPHANGEPRRSDWHALSVGPLCAQLNGSRRRYWHPNIGQPCDVRDAPAWPDGDYAFVIDYLLPQEEISDDRHFVLVPESDKPKPGF